MVMAELSMLGGDGDKGCWAAVTKLDFLALMRPATSVLEFLNYSR